jgi:hypothetical protein
MDNRGNGARIDSVAVPDSGGTVTLPDDTLKRCGAVRGTVSLDGWSDCRRVFILALGCEQFVGVQDSSGFFLFPNLPEGVYDLIFTHLNKEYENFEAAGVTVRAGDTNDIGVITMTTTSQEMFVPRNVTLHYDTSRQIATIRWDACKGVSVNGYQLYKADNDLPRQPYDQTPFKSDSSLKRGVFVDSCLIQDHSYMYEVAAIFGDPGNEQLGPRSAAVACTAVSAYAFVAAIPEPENDLRIPFDVTSNSRREIVAAYQHFGGVTIVWFGVDNRIRKTVQIDSLVARTMPFGAAVFSVDDDDNSWFCDSATREKIVTFDGTGRQRDCFPFKGKINGFDVRNDTMYIVSQSSEVTSYDPKGQKLIEFDFAKDVVCDPCGAVVTSPSFDSANDPRLRITASIFDASGFQKSVTMDPGYMRIMDINKGVLLVRHSQNQLRWMSADGAFLAKHFIQSEFTRAAFVDETTVAVLRGREILVLRRR